MQTKVFPLHDETKTELLGAVLSSVCPADTTIYLTGDLGAGKTTMTRGFVRSRGYKGVVKSPTYTLVEEYQTDGVYVYHFDLYRLNDPEELEMMGIRDYFSPSSVRIVEWPSKGEGILPEADLEVNLEIVGNSRNAVIYARNEKGSAILEKMVFPKPAEL
ncbi:tRNA (adenosine(37)-N6)-threonylcarbamoyltransferase complex ATPase subunit type 1 TsaE [uncultured Ruminobacter sp.]|jgi:tRNA threonylcarbamoyladenosine biosynthesis protein TsaE|uniref:tRNA (adenosine(37)-N6)-threonylcarbamoyltransferase complex ATPase subunit type 1 TsaE n=1 Tax=uncultured Ruminobacter sp. TaxID=538947 RepID=UPI0026127E5A|nr:tRNA (adenosine(37)-N6)-threonylcarbamoyltransferase complex ATPase subunit type 1 TsaE [uncultured Ruminobacter sp.]